MANDDAIDEVLFRDLGASRSETAISMTCGFKNHAIPDVARPSRIGMFEITGWTPNNVQAAILRRADLVMRDETFVSKNFIPLVTQELGISLRILDWMVTNYSRKYGIWIHGELIHHRYKNALSTYLRKNFDPFRRYFDVREIGKVTFDHIGVRYETTVAQLNFIIWCYEHDVVRFVQQNLNEIEADMNATTKCRNQGSSGGVAPLAPLITSSETFSLPI